MKKFLLIFISFLYIKAVPAQRIESFHFNLYTDSLKKGTHNYINVDARLSNGSWKPLTEKELTFTTDNGKMEGNQLVLPANPVYQKVTITVALKSNPKETKSQTIWIKQKPDPAYLDPIEKPRRL